MAEDKKYDIVLGKLPRTDKNGVNISGDRIGKGGRHRKDGTFSSMVEDIRPLDDNDMIVSRTRYNELERAANQRQPSFFEELACTAVNSIVCTLVDKAADDIRDLTNYWWREHKRKKAAKAEAERQARIDAIRTEKLKREAQEHAAVIRAAQHTCDALDVAYNQYTIDMTREEAQKELFEAYVLRIVSDMKAWRVAHANITDNEGRIIPGSEFFDKVCNPEIVGTINQMILNNPILLERTAAITLQDILGRDLVIDSRFNPIECQVLRQKLMEIPAA